MSDFSDKLWASLSKEDEEFLKSLEDERGMFESLGDIFHGKMKGWVIMASALAPIASFFGLWCIWQMFQADTTRGLILWAAAAWASWTLQIQLKQWLWDRIRMLNILRELKKVELRIARLEDTHPQGRS